MSDTKLPNWVFPTTTSEELREAAIQYQKDARFCYLKSRNMIAKADEGKLAGRWLASQIQEASASSAAMARVCRDEAERRSHV